jgi:lipid-A-disaccharide synthase
LVAGEPSGDQLGAGLMNCLKRELGDQTVFAGIGGEQMLSEGLKSLFPMSDLSVMGLAEVLPKIFFLNQRLKQTTRSVQCIDPDILITIDSPGFTFRLAKNVQNLTFPKVHYVAPTVWAWKPSRAQKISNLYDHLMVLLPFEPQYFNYDNMKCTFVGHPIAKDISDKLGVKFREDKKIGKKKALGIFPGSRKSEVLRMLPVFSQVIEQLSTKFPELEIIITTIPHLSPLISSVTRDWKLRITVIDSFSERKAAHQACTVALAASGTITTELAAAKVPVVVGYKVSPITAFIARRLLRVSHVSLVNIIKGKRIIPEFLQDECSSKNLLNAVTELLVNPSVRELQVREQINALRELSEGTEGGYSKASKVIQDTLDSHLNKPSKSRE